MRTAVRPYRSIGVIIVGAGLVLAPTALPVAPWHGGAGSARAVRLAAVDADSPLGAGPAYVIGGSTIAIPPPGYVDAVNQLYLQPHGYTGTPQGLFTPEGLYPLTGPKSLTLDQSLAQGQEILRETIERQIAGGNVDAANPVTVFGWSQSATISSLLMPQLAADGVPSDDVHFILVGDPSNPNGGMLERFHVPIDGESPSAPALGITFSGATPADLYPTDVYTAEYDGFADFPRYPINFLADLNAYLGILTEHTGYPVFSADQIANAVELPTSAADSLTHYYMIPADSLPLLVPLQLIPFIGQPLYDLLEPDMRILVNLGYGSIDHGWDPGPADVPTPFGIFPTDLNWGDVFTALANGAVTGIQNAIADLSNPDNYDLSNIVANPWLNSMIELTNLLGFTDATSVGDLDLAGLLELARNGLSVATGFPTPDVSLFSSSPTEILNMITATLSADYSALLPIADTVNTLLTTVPALLAGFVSEQLAQGDILGAIGEPLAAITGLVPFATIFGAGVPIVEALGGTLVNLADLFGLGGDLTP